MDARFVYLIEKIVSLAAAAMLAAAVAFASAPLGISMVTAGTVTACTFVIALLAQRLVPDGEQAFSIASFAQAELAFDDVAELLLTDPVDAVADGDELVLDDILAGLGENSRVVRLFDPSRMPTPGQLKARVDRHLDQSRAAGDGPDASAALYEALTELRLSLR